MDQNNRQKAEKLRLMIRAEFPDRDNHDGFLFGALVASLRVRGLTSESVKAFLCTEVDSMYQQLDNRLVKPVIVTPDGRGGFKQLA